MTAFAVSRFDAFVETEGERRLLWVVELRDLARGLCAALFLALPLLYTMEMWQRAAVVPAWDIVLIVLACYLANVGFAQFTSFKQRDDRRAPMLDALTAMGIGVLAATVTMLLINRISATGPPITSAKLVILEMVPLSFGASLAINQLGERRGGARQTNRQTSRQTSRRTSRRTSDAKELLAATLGATMFSFNIAPTVEIQLIGNGMSWVHLLGLVAFSVGMSALMVFFARFEEPEEDDGVTRSALVETLMSYLVSLGISAALLWMFGYIDLGTPIELVVPWVVTLGYAATIAGAAGRLIL